MYKQYECYHCDAVFKIKSLSDTETHNHYEVIFCPFCGGDIEEEIDGESDDE